MLKINIKDKPMFKKKRVNYTRRLKTQRLINYLQIELQTSTAHGLPYIVNTESHWCERVFWAFSFLCACIIMFCLLASQYSRLVETPIVMSVEKDYLSWNVSYPSIVLCPVIKIDPRILNRFYNETENSTESHLAPYYTAIASVSLDALNVVDLPPPDILELIKPEDYAKVMKSLFKQFENDTLTTPLPWPISVDAVMTEMGMCHILNSNVAIFDDPEKWSEDKNIYVKRNVDLSFHDTDFFVQILNYADIYKIYTLSPDDIIIYGAKAVTFDSDGFIAVGAEIVSTRASESIKEIPLHLRKCRFIYETDSIRYPVYSYNRCLLECRIKIILKLCGCIPHFYKPLVGERVCSLSELTCLLEYKTQITKLSVTNDTMKKFHDIDGLPKSSRDCGCLGNCEEDVILNDQGTLLPRAKMNRLRINVLRFPRVRVMRDVIFSFYDLFLRSGGVVNLCIGTSVISIMELIMTAVRIPIYEVMQISKAIWRRYTRPQIQKMSLIKKQS